MLVTVNVLYILVMYSTVYLGCITYIGNSKVVT